MADNFKPLENANKGQIVYVTVSGGAFYEGKIVDYGYYYFYPEMKSYKVSVFRNEKKSFIDYFDYVYEKTS